MANYTNINTADTPPLEKVNTPTISIQYGRQLVWKDGMPSLVAMPVISKKAIPALLEAAASLPYDDPLNLEPQYQDKPCIEVAALKLAQKAARGDPQAFKELLDRLLGKAPQKLELAGGDGGPLTLDVRIKKAVDREYDKSESGKDNQN